MKALSVAKQHSKPGSAHCLRYHMYNVKSYAVGQTLQGSLQLKNKSEIVMKL